jgi:hypothetical protein
MNARVLPTRRADPCDAATLSSGNERDGAASAVADPCDAATLSSGNERQRAAPTRATAQLPRAGLSATVLPACRADPCDAATPASGNKRESTSSATRRPVRRRNSLQHAERESASSATRRRSSQGGDERQRAASVRRRRGGNERQRARGDFPGHAALAPGTEILRARGVRSAPGLGFSASAGCALDVRRPARLSL